MLGVERIDDGSHEENLTQGVYRLTVILLSRAKIRVVREHQSRQERKDRVLVNESIEARMGRDDR